MPRLSRCFSSTPHKSFPPSLFSSVSSIFASLLHLLFLRLLRFRLDSCPLLGVILLNSVNLHHLKSQCKEQCLPLQGFALRLRLRGYWLLLQVYCQARREDMLTRYVFAGVQDQDQVLNCFPRLAFVGCYIITITSEFGPHTRGITLEQTIRENR